MSAQARLALVSIECARVDAALARYGARFESRCFTNAERAYCEPRRFAGQHFAARLVAKFAARRVLGAVALREIEVSRDHAGAPSLTLHGGAERARAALGLTLHLSLSHDGGVALALVVGDAE